MKCDKIHYLPKYVNQFGELVVYTKDISVMMDIHEKELEVKRVWLLYGLFIENEERVHVPETIPFEDAVTIVEEIISQSDS